MSFCRAERGICFSFLFTAKADSSSLLLCRNSTRNLCGINNIAQAAQVEFLHIMGSRKAVDALQKLIY